MSELLQLVDKALSLADGIDPGGPVVRHLRRARARVAERVAARSIQEARERYEAQRRARDRQVAKGLPHPEPVRVHGRAGHAAGDLTGLRSGPWKVLGYGEPGHATPKWRCRCQAGHERLINGAQLRNKPPLCAECVAGVAS